MQSTFSCSSVARNYCQWKLHQVDFPAFGVLILDNRHALIRFEIFPRSTAIHKQGVNAALQANATAVILTQNYPSGPGEDIIQRLYTSLSLVGVQVLDHIVVSGSEAFSFRERGLLRQDEEGIKMSGKRPTYHLQDGENPLDKLRGEPCCLPFSHPEYQQPTPEQVDLLIRSMGWSQGDAAMIVGAAYDQKKGSTTLRKWRAPVESSEHREIPYAAWRLLLIQAGLAIEAEKK